jgi:UDP-glucose 4-epimerase
VKEDAVSHAVGDSDRVASYFRGKRILVTGGTGSFGYQIVSRLLPFDPARIVVFSRDEKKHWDMREEFHEHPALDFVLGDIRDAGVVHSAMAEIDIVYHAAALKQVPNCEFHPLEAAKTNVIGTENVRQAAIANNVEVLVAISTDKAVKPVNVMGMTKALAERIILNPANGHARTRLICVRYGNVIGSRGSVVPLFKDRIAARRELPVTDPGMTRFLLTLPDAIHSVFCATMVGDTQALYVNKMPACRIGDLAAAMSEAITGRDDYPIAHIGVRPGEKLHEVLVSEEEMNYAIETDTHYSIRRTHRVQRNDSSCAEYASNSSTLLDKAEIAALLRKTGWV